MNGTQQLNPDAWRQAYNPDRYTGNDYVSSSTVAISPQSDGSAIITPTVPGRYKILARLSGNVYQSYLLARPQSPATPLRGFGLFISGPVDRTYATAVISAMGLTNSNAAHINVFGCINIDSGSFAASAWTGQSWCPGTPLADIEWLIDTLHGQGYQVVLNTAMAALYQGVGGELESFLSSLSDADVESAFSGYAAWSIQVSQLAQKHKVEYLVVGDNFQIYNPAVTTSINSQWVTLLKEMRGAYSGKVYFGNVYPCAPSFAFAEWASVDGVRLESTWSGSTTGCTFPPTIGVYNMHTEEMLPYIRSFESQGGFQLLKQANLPAIWTDLYGANVDGMNSLGATVFTTQTGVFNGKTVPLNTVEDNQEDVDFFEATMRSVVVDTDPLGLFLWDANIAAPFTRGSSSSLYAQSDAMMQPALLGAITNWYGGDPNKFAPCWDAPASQLFQEDFETNACPLSTVFALAQQTAPNASGAQVIADPVNTANHILRITGKGNSDLATGSDYTVTAQVRISGDAQSIAGINLRVSFVNGYNAYTGFIDPTGITLQKSVQGQPSKIQRAAANIGTGQWHSVTMTANGPVITAAVDGATLINYTDPVPLPQGQVVVQGCCDAGSIEDFDNLLVSAAVTDDSSPQISAIVNAASKITVPTSPVSPGEIVLIYGRGFGPNSPIPARPQNGGFPTSLGGVTVYFGTTPAPLLYVASGQIAAIVPYAVSGQMNTAVRISDAGGSTVALTVPVVGTQPGLFSLDSTGTGGGAILNQDLSVNSPANPAARGADIVMFETGEGQTNPTGVDGTLATKSLSKPTAPVTVLIGGIPAKLDYAGAVSDQVAGLMQLNVEVPASAPVGDRVPVLVIVGHYISQSELTIAVR